MSVEEESEESINRVFTAEENATFEYIKTDNANFADYEKQFQEVLLTLENDELLEPFRAEYAGLHHSYLKGHEGESRLLRKCMDLNADIYWCVTKTYEADQLIEGDKITIDSLKTEIEKTVRSQGNTKEKEGALREKIDKLRREVVELEKLAHEPVEAAAQEAALQSLQRVHESVFREREDQEAVVSAIQHDIAFMERRLQKLKENMSYNDTELRAVREATEAKQAEVDALMQSKTKKEEELRTLRQDLTRKNTLCAERQTKMEQLNEEYAKSGEDLRKATAEAELMTDEYHKICRQLQQANTTLQECNEDNDMFQKKVRDTVNELQQYQNKVNQHHKVYLTESKLLDALRRRNVVAERKLQETQVELEAQRDELALKQAELDESKAAAGADDAQMAALHRELNLLHDDYIGAQQKTQENNLWLAEKSSQLHHVEHELAAFEEHAQRQNASLFVVSKECAAYEEQTKKYAYMCANTMAEVQSREQQVAETQQQVQDTEDRLRQQQIMLDAMVGERNAYAKHHAELRHELTEMNRKFQLVLVQIQQMKDEVLRRERDIIAEDEAIAGLSRQRKEIEVQITSLNRRVEKKNRSVEQFNSEVRKLGDVLADAHDEEGRQKRRCRDLIHERDLLHGQAVQRGKELADLYEKIHTQQALLQRGEAMFRDRVHHLEQLEYQTTQLSQQLEHLRRFLQRLPDLRLLINKTTRELNQEKVRVRTLVDESSRPVNLHPYNELQWSEPQTYELAKKVKKLQMELNRRRALLDSKEEAIQVKEAQYMKAKATVAKQPGPEVAEQLTAYQNNLIKKQGQMHQLQESLRHFREQTEFYRSRHDELRDHLAEMAKEYAATKERQEKERAAELRRQHEAMLLGSTRGSEQEEPMVYTGFVAPPLPPTRSINYAPPPLNNYPPMTYANEIVPPPHRPAPAPASSSSMMEADISPLPPRPAVEPSPPLLPAAAPAVHDEDEELAPVAQTHTAPLDDRNSAVSSEYSHSINAPPTAMTEREASTHPSMNTEAERETSNSPPRAAHTPPPMEE